jgi:hypothetical protein
MTITAPVNTLMMRRAVRRSLIAVLLVVAALAAFGLTRLRSGPDQASATFVPTVSPGANDKIPQQGQITINLVSGWGASLRVDQVPIPDNQLNREQDPTVSARQQLLFQPGPGKAMEYFQTGQNCAELTYWPLRTGPGQSFTKTWCFTAF